MAGARTVSNDLSVHARLLCALGLLAVLAFPRSATAEEVLRWGGDAEGGAPFVEADPSNADVVRGFDVEVAEEIARRLGRKAEFVQVTYASIDQSVERGDFEIGLSGVEDTGPRRSEHSTTLPYFEFREVLTVRAGDRERVKALTDLSGKPVGTLGGTMAYDLLTKQQSKFGYEVVSYDDDVHPYSDVVNGRLYGVVLDHIIAARAERRQTGLFTHPEAIARGHYVGVLAKNQSALRDRVDDALRGMMRDGTLEKILRKWAIWDDQQKQLFDRIVGGEVPPAFTIAGEEAARKPTMSEQVRSYLPAIFRAALITIALSCASMLLAIVLGLVVASGRVYGGRIVKAIFTGYVELMRGTPLLLQLFVIYYGLASVVRLPAFVAACVGLGLNYAAFESEIYRGALEAVPKGQLEAARTLGLTERQVFRLIRAPQALRIALPPMTNDFVALLKDSSLVSVITVVELTKETSIFAANIGSWFLPGAICAALYLLMSLPLARLARRLEARWKAAGT